MPSMQSSKAYLRSMEKKIPKSVGARMQSCFMPLLTGKEADVPPVKQAVLCIPSWKDVSI